MTNRLKEYLTTDGVKLALKEGGAAVADVVRINQLNTDDTVANIYGRFLYPVGIDNTQFTLLGSTGKKDPAKNGTPEGSSGDVDVAIKASRDMLNRLQEIAKRDGLQSNLMSGLGILSVRFPISNTDGLQANQFVQVDFIPVADLEFCSWAYYSPAYDESAYKGLFRNEVLFALAKRCFHEVLDASPAGDPVKWTRGKLDLSNGLYNITKSKVGKSGKVVQSAKTLDSTFVTRDPDQVVSELFGEIGRSSKDILTFEQAIDALQDPSFRFRSDLQAIVEDVSKGIQGKKQPIPALLSKIQY